jgi:Zinc carboxypeptidase
MFTAGEAMTPVRIVARVLCLLAVATLAGPLAAQTRLTSPTEFLGFNLGDDYHLANYQQISAYWRKLDQESDRMVVREIGRTAEGRTMLMAIVSSPENIRSLDRYQDISRRLALAEGLTDDEARRLATEGRAVVWIDGGLHASEVLGAQQLAETAWQMVSRTDDETTRILDDVIILFVHANPDGNDLAADWYNRNPVPERRTMAPGLPRLYQKYIGHDNNRDFFASTQPETEAMNRVMYHEWLPQIVYNHHQTGPAGTVMFAPPFRDPFNYNFDPLVVVQLDLVAAAMHSRFEAEGKPGVTMRSGARYSTWWNGGLRTTAYFHNMIGILTETIGNPTPMRIPYVADRVLPRADLPFPIQPQEWHFRQSIDYSVTANRAILDLASRNRENFLFNIYRMGKNSIERGSRDSWTITASEAARANEVLAQRQPAERGGQGSPPTAAAARGASTFDPYAEILHAPDARDPRAYVIPWSQPDFLTATKFVNALREVNVAVHRATAAFEVQGKRYPAGSYVVFAAQAFRPHVLDMFEPQDHPNDFPYPGAPPTPPYDNAGWTPAYTMGVEFDRILEGFTGPFERITDWNVKPALGTVTGVDRPAGYVTSHWVNDAFHAVSRLLADGEQVYWLAAPAAGAPFYVAAKSSTRGRLDRLAAELGLSFEGVASRPPGDALALRQPRIGLLDVYGGSMPSGWTRWVLEQFGTPYERTFPPRLDQGDLNAKYDVLVFPDGTVPDPNRAEGPRGGRRDEPVSPAANDSIEASLPAEYRNQRGRATDTTLAAIKRFVEQGGIVIAIGRSAPGLATYLGLPVRDHLLENGEPLPRTKYYVPGSVLRAAVDTTHPLAAGLAPSVDVFFDNSPVFTLEADAAAKGVRRVAWFGDKTPLRSGWAWGQERLEGGATVVEATVGRGTVFLLGPEILFRGQPHGTFKFFFNAIYYGTATRGEF